MANTKVYTLATVEVPGLGEYRACETIEENWNYYSKRYHNAHGPKRTVHDRRVQRKNADGVIEVVARLNRWPPAKIGGAHAAIIKTIPEDVVVSLLCLDANLDTAIKHWLANGGRRA